jgi:CubicO group peptidase (beta-lactamase class C family)
MLISSPSAQHVDARGISSFLDAIESDPRIEPHGLIVQRHGHRIAEGYWAPHTAGSSRLVYSLSKSFTGTALGLLVGDGRLSLDDLVGDHLPELFDDDTPEAVRRMRIRDIASMASGHAAETLLDSVLADPDDPVRGFLTIAPDAEPGTLFAYNQPPVLALARILERVAGERLADLLRRRVLDPIGAGDLRWRQIAGSDMGFSGVFTSLDTVARLGQLHLDDGVWDGRRILPEGWVAAASSLQTPNGDWEQVDWQQGYGFQFWMARHGYRGDGAYGQFMVILPEHDAVVAMFSCTDQMQDVLDAMWEHLLPAMGNGTDCGGVDTDEALAERMCHLALPTVGERLGGVAPDDIACDVLPSARVAVRRTSRSPASTPTERASPSTRRRVRSPWRSASGGRSTARSLRAPPGSGTAGSPSTWCSSTPRTASRSNSIRPRPRSSPDGRSCRCSVSVPTIVSLRCGRCPTERFADATAVRHADGKIVSQSRRMLTVTQPSRSATAVIGSVSSKVAAVLSYANSRSPSSWSTSMARPPCGLAWAHSSISRSPPELPAANSGGLPIWLWMCSILAPPSFALPICVTVRRTTGRPSSSRSNR